MSDLVNRIEELIAPMLAQEQIELVDLTYQKGPEGWTLCAYLDKAGGITLDDCSQWSSQIGQALDESETISHAYLLEVSSPGLDRPIKKLADYQRFKGERVSVKLFAPLDGQKNFHGFLGDVSADAVSLVVEGNRTVTLPFKKIARTKLDPIIEI